MAVVIGVYGALISAAWRRRPTNERVQLLAYLCGYMPGVAKRECEQVLCGFLAYPLIKPLFICLSAYTVYSVLNLGKLYFINYNSIFLWLAQPIV